MTYELFEMEHIKGFVPLSSVENLKLVMESMMSTQDNIIWSLMIKGKVVAFAFVRNFRVGVAEVGMLMSKDIYKDRMGLQKVVLKLIEYCEKELGIHRLQMSVEQGFQMGVRWAHSLGFLYEGTMLKYGYDKKNHLLFSRVN